MNVTNNDNSTRKPWFANAISGIVYDNNNYLRQCRYALHLETANRLKQQNKSNNHYLVKQQHCDNRLERDSKSNSMKKNEYNECNFPTSILHNTDMSFQSHIGFQKQEKLKVQKNNKKVFIFPNIDIKLIDQIHCTKDLFDKVLTVNFGQHFLKLFPKSLSGTLTASFVETFDKYLQILTGTGKLDTPIVPSNYKFPQKACKSKRAFLQKIEELQNQKNFRAIEQMIKHYCVPNPQIRQSCLRDILCMLSQSLYERFNLNREKQYVLLNQSGNLIEQVCSIRFNTTMLLVSNKQHFQSSFAKYKTILQRSRLNFTKISLTDSCWYRNFRETFVGERYNEPACGNKTNQSQVTKKRTKSYQLTHRSLEKSNKFDALKTERKITVTNSSQKKVLHKRTNSSLTNEQLRSQFATIKIQTIASKKRYQVYEKMFHKLQNANNIIDITFNSFNYDQLPMSVLKMKCQLFKGKSTEHIDEILNALQIDPKQNCISKSQFITINEVAMCKGEHSKIMEFVCRYLPFNEYGELNKESLSKVLKLSLKNVSNEELVLNIVWSWLDRNGFVEDEVVLRNSLKSWYDKNKMVFAIMVSLIFGTYSTSFINMTHQVFV